MRSIRDISRQAIAAGYLTIEAENQLRHLLQLTQYSLEDLNTFMRLQQDAMEGRIKQESREQRDRSQNHRYRSYAQYNALRQQYCTTPSHC